MYGRYFIHVQTLSGRRPKLMAVPINGIYHNYELAVCVNAFSPYSQLGIHLQSIEHIIIGRVVDEDDTEETTTTKMSSHSIVSCVCVASAKMAKYATQR